jgi:hypothetical protein
VPPGKLNRSASHRIAMGTITKDDLTGPLYAISDDLERAKNDLTTNDDSYSRRNYIRVLFASIELGIYLLNRTVLVAATGGSGPLTFADLVMLREQTFNLDESGQVRIRDKFLRLADNLRFTVRCVEKGFGLSLNFDAAGTHWDDFKHATKVRNRITHPKSHQDLQVTDQEIALAQRVGDWFSGFIVDWFQKFIVAAKPAYEVDSDKMDQYVM